MEKRPILSFVLSLLLYCCVAKHRLRNPRARKVLLEESGTTAAPLAIRKEEPEIERVEAALRLAINRVDSNFDLITIPDKGKNRCANAVFVGGRKGRILRLNAFVRARCE